MQRSPPTPAANGLLRQQHRRQRGVHHQRRRHRRHSGLGTFPDGGGGPPCDRDDSRLNRGRGNLLPGSKTLTVGSNNLSTLQSAEPSKTAARAAGTGGSLVKVGTGTLTLSGENTYTGMTTISQGAINLTGQLLSPCQREGERNPGQYRKRWLNTVTNAGTVAPGLGLPAGQFGALDRQQLRGRRRHNGHEHVPRHRQLALGQAHHQRRHCHGHIHRCESPMRAAPAPRR